MNTPQTVPDLSPQTLRAFLRANNWSLASRPRTNAEVWERNQHEVLLPLNDQAVDYGRRLRNFIEDLAEARGATEEDIARELLYIEDDVISIKLAEVRDYVPLADAAQLIGNAKELAIASACSAITRRAYHGRSRPHRARRYARIVGMGHTRRGSFIIPMVSPVRAIPPVAVSVESYPSLDIEAETDFFPRRVTGMMADVLKSILRIAVLPERMPNQEELQHAVADGLSADACLATSAILSASPSEDVDITFEWALSATPMRAGGDELKFPTESAELIAEVGHVLQEQVQTEHSVLYGFVSSLDRDEGDSVGTIKLKTLYRGRERPVKIILNENDYHAAVEAHDLRMRVVVAGTVVKSSTGTLIVSSVDSFRPDDYLPIDASTAEIS